MDDAILDEIRAALPAGWSLSISATEVRIERDEPVWVLYENRINAPVKMESEQVREARIKSHGRRLTAGLVYRAEPRWTDAALTDAEATNARLHTELVALAGGVEHLRDRRFGKGPMYVPHTPAEERELRDYEAARDAIEARVIALPSCNTEQRSLFLVSETGLADDMQVVHPEPASEELYWIRDRVRAACGSAP